MPAARRETAILLLGDVVLLLISLWFALSIRNLALPSGMYFWEHLRGFIFVYAASLLIFYISGLYERQTRLVKRILGTRIIGAQTANTVIAALVFFVLPFEVAPKTVLALYLFISVALISAWRFFLVPVMSIAPQEQAVLIGEGEAVEEVLRTVQGNAKYYLDFIAHIRPSELAPGTLASRIRAHTSQNARLIILDTRDPRVRSELAGLYDSLLAGCTFMEFSTFFESIFDKVPGEHIDHAWLLEHLPNRNLPYALGKRAIDLGGAAIGIVLATPFILLAMIAILLGGGGQPFIRHQRIGRGNRLFSIIKLRTMLINDHGDPELQKKNRVTSVGRFLRTTRIDELPQLLNILRGELSFVGPRPELPSIAQVYTEELSYYEVRHLIPPGLSGWAQIYHKDAPRGGADIERTRQKLAYDLYYLKYRSFGLDMAISLKTLRTLFSFSGT